MNLVEIVRLKYPGEIEKRNISFRRPWPEDEISIDKWEVEGVEKPNEAELLALEPEYENEFKLNSIKEFGNNYITKLLDSMAQSKQYYNAISCVSYSNSTNEFWKNESLAFIEWRDNVFKYAIDIYSGVESGSIPVPSLDDFINGLPTITWPK